MKKQTTKRALLLSALSLVICVAMLVGTTFAWFTDSVTSANNIIKSGNLDVELYYQNDETADWVKVDSNTNVFKTNTLWEPGHTEVVKLKVVNEGSLALKYQLGVNVVSEIGSVNVNNKEFKLSDFIKYGVVEGAENYTREQAVAAVDANATALKSAYDSDTIALEAKNDTDSDEKVVTMVVYMPTTVGNEANHKTGEVAPTINLGINVFATQMTSEEDSFDNQYDKDAYLPVVYSLSELKNAIADGNSVKLGADITVTEADAENGNAIYYTGDKSITIDLGGHTLTGNTSNVVIRIQKSEGNENTITIKNGKIVADANSWSAVSVGSSTTTKTYVNLENLEISSCKPNDMAVRSRPGAEFTITDCKITSTNGAGGVAAGGGNVTLNNVTVDQYGVYNWNSVALGVSNGANMTVNSGSYTSDPKGNAKGNWVAYVMSSGGTLEINGGTFSGTVANTASAANACGIICADKAAVVNIKDGTFTSNGAILDMRNNVGTLPNPVATIYGGTFSSDPRVSGLYSSNLISVANGYMAVTSGELYYVIPVDAGVTLTATAHAGIYAGAAKNYYVFDKTGLMNLNALFAEIVPNEGNINTVNLMADVNLAGVNWKPIESMWIVFNGKGHTISNITAGMDSTGRRSGFWSYAGAVTINDLTLENVTVTGSQAGTFVGSAEGLKINNCFLKGVNKVNYVDGVEDWNGVGAISGVVVNSTMNVTIVEGATVTLNKVGFSTASGCAFVDNLTGYISANQGTVVNNGQINVVS